jgi:5-methylcytosine-specific restriction endonuclease McrA
MANRITIACASCGSLFDVKLSRINKAKYCSRACQADARRLPHSSCRACGESVRHSRGFCSLACRDAGGRVDVTCQHCGTAFTQKASEADARRFCSRRCMQTAWGCRRCAKLVSSSRRERAEPYCSDRCELGDLLDAEAERSGNRHAYCFACQTVLPQDAFHREKTSRNGLSARCKDCTRAKYEASKDAYRLRRYHYQAAPGGQIIPFTTEEKAQRFAMWGGRCWRCGIADATEDDHVKPISRGGSHCLSNLRPICRSCNASKRGSWPLTGDWRRANFRHPAQVPGSDRERRRPREPRRLTTCPQCERTRLVRAFEARNHTYCSPECALAARRREPVTLVCDCCDARFTVPDQKWARRRRFCSRSCAGRRSVTTRSSWGEGQLALWEA